MDRIWCFFSCFALTLLTINLCGWHDSGGRSWGGDCSWGNHRSNACTGSSLATRGGAWLVARRWSTWGGADVGSGRFRQAWAYEKNQTGFRYTFLKFENAHFLGGSGYLPLSWAGLFKEIFLWSEGLAWSLTWVQSQMIKLTPQNKVTFNTISSQLKWWLLI